jgi:tripartite-type tricarboxylate transporter receptor subunit TctC
MKLSRRKLLYVAASAAALPAMPRIAWALNYPTRPVRIVVGFSAGGPTDLIARLAAQMLSERIGQQAIVENRPGASGNIATEVVVRSAPDGYTLLVGGVSNAISATLYSNLSFNFIRDIEPVAGIIRAPNVLAASPLFPAKTIPALIAYAKANPGKANFASAGNGTSQHLSGELLNMMAGINLVHVPYRGAAQALTDVIAGQVPLVFASSPGLVGYAKTGKLRLLGVTSAVRSEVLPDVPAIAETVPGYEVSAWFGVGAPKDTPREIVGRLNDAINVALADPKIKERLANLGGVPMGLTPTEFGKLIARETEKWAKVIKFANIKAD